MNTKQYSDKLGTTKNKPLIFIAGGGGYEDSAELDKLFFENIPENGKILYLPFARETHDDSWIKGLVHRFSDTIDVVMPKAEEVSETDFSNFDAIFIGGGNTYRLLDFIITHGLDKKIKNYIKSGHGSFYGGSAGAIITGKSIDTASKMDDSTGYTKRIGLDLLDGANVACHWPRCNDYIHDFAKQNNCKIYCLPENCGMIFDNDGRLIMTIGTGTEIL